MADYDIGAAFGEIEDELISSMIRNLKRHQVEEIAEGMEWSQWQALQLQALEDYKRKAAQKYGSKFSTINDKVDKMLTDTYNTAETSQEQKILKAIQKGIPETVTPLTGSGEIQGEFFKTNDRKLDALIKATTSDMEKAEHAVLRMTDDKYRKIIFNAQVYANTGAGTYQKAVDMATKDFLSAGINCIEYKNGRRVPIDVYAEMAIRTANKRAYLQGEGEMRKKWGIHTVIMNKRTNPCPKCAPFVGKVIVDDVWSGGTAEEAEKSGYLLMSDCIKRGLYHPNCQDSHTTYFGDILDEEEEENTAEQEQTEGEPETNDKGVSETDTPKNAESSTEDGVRQMPLTEESEYFARENGYDSTVPTSENQITPREQRINEQLYDAEQRQNHCERQVQRFERMGKYSLDKDNQRIYKARKSEWKEKKKEVDLQINEIKREINKAQNKVNRPRIKSLALASSDPVRLTNYSLNISPDIEKKNENNSPQEVANSGGSGIIDVRTEMHRQFDPNQDRRKDLHFVSDTTFSNLTVEARINGANILRGGEEIEHHLDTVGADASIVGDTILFRKDVCVSEVLEETHHYMQNLNHMNDDKPEPLRTYLNEIDAKEYLLNNARKYKIPRNEIETTKKQLESYKAELEKYVKEFGEHE